MCFTYKYIPLLFLAFFLGACNQAETPYERKEPAKVLAIENSDLNKVELTEKAIERIGIKTTAVTEQPSNQTATAKQLKVPYSSVLYDATGDAWVYTNPDPNNYVRHKIKIDYIDQGTAFLAEGPSAGTAVVSQGAVELLGTEFHVGH